MQRITAHDEIMTVFSEASLNADWIEDRDGWTIQSGDYGERRVVVHYRPFDDVEDPDCPSDGEFESHIAYIEIEEVE